MTRWFRWYEGTSEDGKFRVVARLSRVTLRDVIALWAFMLEDAAHLEHRGVCKRNEDFMASILDFENGVVENILEAMETADMISVGQGGITICNWGKRQFEGDTDPTAAERQRRKRTRDKSVSNAPVTRDSRPPDTDTDTEKDIGAVANATRSPDLFPEFWKEYPKRDGSNPRAPAEKVFRSAVKSGANPEAIIAGAKRYKRDLEKRGQVGSSYVAQALTWLRQRRWDDYSEPIFAVIPKEPDWDKAVENYVKFSVWPRELGGEPGMTTCRVPSEILQRHKIDPATGRPAA